MELKSGFVFCVALVICNLDIILTDDDLFNECLHKLRFWEHSTYYGVRGVQILRLQWKDHGTMQGATDDQIGKGCMSMFNKKKSTEDYNVIMNEFQHQDNFIGQSKYQDGQNELDIDRVQFSGSDPEFLPFLCKYEPIETEWSTNILTNLVDNKRDHSNMWRNFLIASIRAPMTSHQCLDLHHSKADEVFLHAMEIHQSKSIEVWKEEAIPIPYLSVLNNLPFLEKFFCNDSNPESFTSTTEFKEILVLIHRTTLTYSEARNYKRKLLIEGWRKPEPATADQSLPCIDVSFDSTTQSWIVNNKKKTVYKFVENPREMYTFWEKLLPKFCKQDPESTMVKANSSTEQSVELNLANVRRIVSVFDDPKHETLFKLVWREGGTPSDAASHQSGSGCLSLHLTPYKDKFHAYIIQYQHEEANKKSTKFRDDDEELFTYQYILLNQNESEAVAPLFCRDDSIETKWFKDILVQIKMMSLYFSRNNMLRSFLLAAYDTHQKCLDIYSSRMYDDEVYSTKVYEGDEYHNLDDAFIHIINVHQPEFIRKWRSEELSMTYSGLITDLMSLKQYFCKSTLSFTATSITEITSSHFFKVTLVAIQALMLAPIEEINYKRNFLIAAWNQSASTGTHRRPPCVDVEYDRSTQSWIIRKIHNQEHYSMNFQMKPSLIENFREQYHFNTKLKPMFCSTIERNDITKEKLFALALDILQWSASGFYSNGAEALMRLIWKPSGTAVGPIDDFHFQGKGCINLHYNKDIDPTGFYVVEFADQNRSTNDLLATIKLNNIQVRIPVTEREWSIKPTLKFFCKDTPEETKLFKDALMVFVNKFQVLEPNKMRNILMAVWNRTSRAVTQLEGHNPSGCADMYINSSLSKYSVHVIHFHQPQFVRKMINQSFKFVIDKDSVQDVEKYFCPTIGKEITDVNLTSSKFFKDAVTALNASVADMSSAYATTFLYAVIRFHNNSPCVDVGYEVGEMKWLVNRIHNHEEFAKLKGLTRPGRISNNKIFESNVMPFFCKIDSIEDRTADSATEVNEDFVDQERAYSKPAMSNSKGFSSVKHNNPDVSRAASRNKDSSNHNDRHADVMHTNGRTGFTSIDGRTTASHNMDARHPGHWNKDSGITQFSNTHGENVGVLQKNPSLGVPSSTHGNQQRQHLSLKGKQLSLSNLLKFLINFIKQIWHKAFHHKASNNTDEKKRLK